MGGTKGSQRASGSESQKTTLSWDRSLQLDCVNPGTYSPWHSDPRLLAIPTSWSRVADSNPDYDALYEVRLLSRGRFSLYAPFVSETASCFLLPFDLHVLGLPPAFNLSHDQTLQFKHLWVFKKP